MVIKDNIKFNSDFTKKLQELLQLPTDEVLSGVLRGFEFSNVKNTNGVVSFDISHGYCVINNIILEKEDSSSHNFFSGNQNKFIYLKFIYSLTWGEPTGELIYENNLIHTPSTILLGKYDYDANVILPLGRDIQTKINALFLECNASTEDVNQIDITQFYKTLSDLPKVPTRLPQCEPNTTFNPSSDSSLSTNQLDKTLALHHPHCHVQSVDSTLFVATSDYNLSFVLNGYEFNTNGTDLSIDLDGFNSNVKVDLVLEQHSITQTGTIYRESNKLYEEPYQDDMDMNGFPNVYSDGNELYQLVYSLKVTEVTPETPITNETLLTIDLTGATEQFHPIYNPNGLMLSENNKHWFEEYTGTTGGTERMFKDLPLERVVIAPQSNDYSYSDFVNTINTAYDNHDYIPKQLFPRTFRQDTQDMQYGNEIAITRTIADIETSVGTKGIEWQL
jgi:hypothetical protein